MRTAYKVGIGAAVLAGGFFAFHAFRKWQAQKRLDELRAMAVSGQITTRQFLEQTLIDGVSLTPGTPVVSVQEATRLPCSQVFPLPAGSANPIPGFDAAIAEMRQLGRCL